MYGVDVQYQMLASHPIMRRALKAYKNIFFYILDITIFKSFCVWKSINGRNIHYRDFRLDLVEQLLEGVTLPAKVSPGRPRTQNPLRAQAESWGHFPGQIPPTPKKKFLSRNCVVCYKHGNRSEVRWLCNKCGVALQLENCFETYHTQLDY